MRAGTGFTRLKQAVGGGEVEEGQVTWSAGNTLGAQEVQPILHEPEMEYHNKRPVSFVFSMFFFNIIYMNTSYH